MKHNKRLTNFARTLRKEPAPAEVALWKLLRNKQLAGFRFRRQHVVEPYIVDYCCIQAMLIVELDGESHLSTQSKDSVRTLYLESQGYKVLRVWNTVLGEDEEAVLEMIYRECVTRTNGSESLTKN